jgi:hypothetical protein
VPLLLYSPIQTLGVLGLIIACAMPEPALARETARVLPAGIFRARVVGVVTSEVSDTFNEQGKLQSLSHGLNRTVTLSDLAANADAATRVRLHTLISSLNALESGLGNQLAASELSSSLSVQQQISLLALERGVTDRLSLGIRVPVVRRSARNRFHVDTVNNAAAVSSLLGSLSPEITGGLFSVSNQSLDTGFFENALFTAKGYDPPRDFERTQLGDVEFGGKYNFFRSERFYSSVLLGMGAPTGAKADLRNPFDKGNSREAWCYAVQLLQEAYPAKGLTLGAAGKIGHSLKDTRTRAVPRDANDSLPSLLPEHGQVQSVSRQRGYQLDTEVSALYRFDGNKFGLWSAYQFSQKGKDSFSGPGNLHYAGLERNSDWQVQAGEVGAEFSTIPAYRKGTFGLPLEVSLLYNRVLQGRNTPMASYTRMDLMVYF